MAAKTAADPVNMAKIKAALAKALAKRLPTTPASSTFIFSPTFMSFAIPKTTKPAHCHVRA
jgi:hypothetical protein